MQIVDFSYTEINSANTYPYYQNSPSRNLISYLKDNREKITDFYPEFKSAITYLYNYNYSPTVLKNGLKISKLFGPTDYHFLVKSHLNSLKSYFSKKLNTTSIITTVDTSPIMERDLAVRSNLGFWGKNNMLIHKNYGSFTIIGTLLLPEKLNLKTRSTNNYSCKDCDLCIKSCPTGALSKNNLDLTKCISYFTLISKEEKPPEGYKKSKFFLGCDICQECCPYNKNTVTTVNLNFITDILGQDIYTLIKFLESLSNRKFINLFRNSGLIHLGKKRLLKNLYLHI